MKKDKIDSLRRLSINNVIMFDNLIELAKMAQNDLTNITVKRKISWTDDKGRKRYDISEDLEKILYNGATLLEEKNYDEVDWDVKPSYVPAIQLMIHVWSRT